MINFNFKIKEKYFKLLNFQITQTKEDLSFYEKISKAEYLAIENYIDKPEKILELGCGLGRVSIFLNSQLNNSPKFFLADFSEVSNKVKYGWNPKDSKYNNLELTEQFCTENGLNNFEILDLSKNKLDKLSNIDMVISMLSVGFHYPIEEYINQLIKISSKNVTMIFGVRKGIYNQDSFKNLFLETKILQISNIDIKEDILILKNIK